MLYSFTLAVIVPTSGYTGSVAVLGITFLTKTVFSTGNYIQVSEKIKKQDLQNRRMNLNETTPTDLDPGRWGDETVLVLGAPYIGKSHLFDEAESVSRVKTLIEAVESSAEEFVVVDEFYRAYQAADEDTRQEFVDWMQDNDGICVSARPRAFDWLIYEDDIELDTRFLNSFDSAYHLRYDPEERGRAVERCLDIGGSGENGLDRDGVEESIDEVLFYDEYEYSDALCEYFGTETYSATLVPGLVAYFSDQLGDANEAFVSRSVVETSKELGRDFFENLGISKLIESTSDTTFFSRETLSSVMDTIGEIPETVSEEVSMEDAAELASPAAVGSLVPFLGPAAAVGGSLALWLRMRPDDSLESKEVFEVLAGEEMTPTARAELERELGLPPRTIDNFQRLTRGETLERLLQHREQVEAEIEGVEEDLATIETAVNEHAEDLEMVEEFVSALETYNVDAEQVASFISIGLKRATANIEDLETRLLNNERRLLQTEDIAFTDIPYWGDEPSQITSATEAGGLVLVNGVAGTGKTTAIYKACRELQATGYSVFLPRFEEVETQFIEHVLTEHEEEIILYANYTIGSEYVASPSDVQSLLRWLAEDIVDTVILECRSEYIGELRQVTRKKTTKQSELEAVWQQHRSVEFKPKDNESETVEQIIAWVLETFDREKDELRNETLERIRYMSAGKPQVLKIATRINITEGSEVDTLNRPYNLYWSDIKNLTVSDPQRRIFEYVCIMESPTTEELSELTGFPYGELANHGKHLSGYLGGEIQSIFQNSDGTPTLFGDETWNVAPIVYREAVFAQRVIHDGNLGEYLTNIDDAGCYRLLLHVIDNLVSVMLYARSWDDEKFIRNIKENNNRLLRDVHRSDAEDAVFAECVVRSIHRGFVFDPELLVNYEDALITGIESLNSGDVNVPEAILNPENLHISVSESLESIYLSVLTGLTTNHIYSGREVSDIAETVLSQLSNTETILEFDGKEILHNYYIRLASRLLEPTVQKTIRAQFYDIDTEDIESQREDLTQYLTGVLNEMPPTMQASSTLGGVIADLQLSAEDATAFERGLNFVTPMATTLAEESQSELDSDMAFFSMFGQALRETAKQSPDPEPVESYLQKLTDMIYTYATDSDKPTQFEFESGQREEHPLSYTYSEMIGGIARAQISADNRSAWIELISDYFVEAADRMDGNHSSLIFNYYARAFMDIIAPRNRTIQASVEVQYMAPDEVESELQVLIKHLLQTAYEAEIGFDTPDELLLESFGSMGKQTLNSFGEDNPEFVRTWHDWIIEECHQIATEKNLSIYSRSEFVADVCASFLFKCIIEYEDPENLTPQLNLFERTIEAVSQIVETDHDEFVIEVYRSIIGRLTKDKLPERFLTIWYQPVADSAVNLISPDSLDSFYESLMTSIGNDAPAAWLVVVENLVSRITGDDPVCKNREKRIELAGGTLGNVAVLFWRNQRGFETEVSGQFFHAVAEIADDDVDLFVAVVELMTHKFIERCE